MEQLLEKIDVEENDNKPKNVQLIIKKNKKRQYLKIFIVVFISVLLFKSINWLYNTVSNLTIEQVIFLLEVPMQGTNIDILWKYLKEVIPISLIISLAVVFFMKVLVKKSIIRKIIVLVILVFSLTYSVLKLGLNVFIKNLIIDSDFIEKNYVAANETNIVFPEQKNNLIYIFLESMEASYTSKENGGIYENDLIPELSKIADENINFSNTDKLGGAINFTGANWTIAAMVSQTSGLPLKINAVDNDYNNYPIFLPGVYSIRRSFRKKWI